MNGIRSCVFLTSLLAIPAVVSAAQNIGDCVAGTLSSYAGVTCLIDGKIFSFNSNDYFRSTGNGAVDTPD
ncbi:MAG: hypothetical protein KGN84_15770, partial [Acidobacteriota bacterium]|nr:hypothetical protein [Acidobacteriota bacterium]